MGRRRRRQNAIFYIAAVNIIEFPVAATSEAWLARSGEARRKSFRQLLACPHMSRRVDWPATRLRHWRAYRSMAAAIGMYSAAATSSASLYYHDG